jgi:hypothetical protein
MRNITVSVRFVETNVLLYAPETQHGTEEPLDACGVMLTLQELQAE